MTTKWVKATQDQVKNVQVGDKIKVNGVETEVTRIYNRAVGDYGFDIRHKVEVNDNFYCDTVADYEVTRHFDNHTFEIEDKSVTPLSPFFGKKYRVTPETSKLLAEACGGKYWWWMDGKPFLYVSKDGTITHQYEDWGHFQNSPLPEATLEVVKTVIIKDVIPVKTEQQLKLEELQKALDEHKKTIEAATNTMKDLEEQIKGMKE